MFCILGVNLMSRKMGRCIDLVNGIDPIYDTGID